MFSHLHSRTRTQNGGSQYHNRRGVYPLKDYVVRCAHWRVLSRLQKGARPRLHPNGLGDSVADDIRLLKDHAKGGEEEEEEGYQPKVKEEKGVLPAAA